MTGIVVSYFLSMVQHATLKGVGGGGAGWSRGGGILSATALRCTPIHAQTYVDL